ncbi:MAG: hypothetical protein AAFZ07_08010 [Actinomycetota bacterium]
MLLFVEFTHLRLLDAVVSGCEFQKLPYSRAPRQLLLVRQRLLERGEAELVEEDFLGRPQHRLIPSRSADLGVFDDEQLQTVDDVLGQLDGMTAGPVSELSHQEPGWQLTEIGETIPFATAFLDFPQIETPTSRRLANDVASQYGLTATR